jgi:hypothetical protein
MYNESKVIKVADATVICAITIITLLLRLQAVLGDDDLLFASSL